MHYRFLTKRDNSYRRKMREATLANFKSRFYFSDSFELQYMKL